MLKQYQDAVSKFTQNDFEIREPTGSISDHFEDQVEKHADRTAIKFKEQTLTYRELNRAANLLARTILNRIGVGNEPVALLMEHGAEIIVAILAVLKAGKVFVALDPTEPKTRLSFTLQDLETPLVITDELNLDYALDLSGGTIKVLHAGELDKNLSDQNLGLVISPDHMSSIYYTSGSTGKPKGVIYSHRVNLHDVWIDSYLNCINNEDRKSNLNSANYGVMLFDIFSPLLNGASVYPFDIRNEGLNQLPHWLEENEITIFHPPIMVLRQLFEILPDGEHFPNLRLLKAGGSTLYRQDVELFQKRFYPHCILEHGYGATETFLIAKFFVDRSLTLSGNVVPAGYPMGDKEILILDENGEELGRGQVGEIAVRSRFHSLGYWRRPELYNEKFPPHLQDGGKRVYLTGDLGRLRSDNCLEHHGRKDFQVKIRGYRVELAEVEGALLNHETVKDAVVVVWEDQPGDRNLVAYLVPSSQPPLSTNILRNALMESLPSFMIPSIFIMMEDFPRTTTGKIDRNALPEPGRNRPELETPYVPPQSSLEREIEAIWRGVLNLDQIGINDDFIELGGHSLQAFQIVTRVFETFSVDIPVRDLFETSTIANMAAIISKHQPSENEANKLEQIIAELDTLSDDEARILTTKLDD